MSNLRFIRVKYSCKCVRTNIVDIKDWENQQQEDIRDISGRIIMSVYKDYAKCSECSEKQQYARSMQ
jgi:predicted fused transcriptional regulator/phosphomethylpyrimidine kinase